MIGQEGLKLVMSWLLRRNLSEAITAMDNYLASYPLQKHTDELLSIKTDYQLMTDYWRRGFKDTQLNNLYNSLLRKMYVFYTDTSVNYAISHSSLLSSLYQRGIARNGHSVDGQSIKNSLEAFVSELALLTLEPDHTAAIKKEELYQKHFQLMDSFFCYLVTSATWTETFADTIENLLLLPTIDSNDQQLMISAIMLSAIEHFDISKFRVLVHVYQRTTDEHVKQRALVGWVFSMESGTPEIGHKLYPEEISLVGELLEDETCCSELVDLQKQLVYCLNAEKDNATIQDEIMPDLLKSQGFRITPHGIEEKESDMLRDILYPDDDEKNLEKMEAGFNRMMDMQKQGSDIYFSGFSRMKSHPFFSKLCNWFVPFYVDHPDASQSLSDIKNSRFLKSILDNGPFCNSDKYSFLLTFKQVIDRLTPQLQEMMNESVSVLEKVPQETMDSPAYIRRIYLQDLYRFFRICPYRREFKNIFEADSNQFLFMANTIFSGTQLELRFNEVTAFMIKKGMLRAAADMLCNYGKFRKDFHFYLMAGYLARKRVQRLPESEIGKQLTERTCYEHAVALQPEHERALVGYARALFDDGLFKEALSVYEKLILLQPEKKDFLLYKAVCLIKLSQSTAALTILFQLHYEDADNKSVKQALAWALTCEGKYQQADNFYRQLLAENKPELDDLLNYGYCLWLNGDIEGAIDCFHRYLSDTGEEAEFILEHEKELLLSKGISEPEMQMMIGVL